MVSKKNIKMKSTGNSMKENDIVKNEYLINDLLFPSNTIIKSP